MVLSGKEIWPLGGKSLGFEVVISSDNGAQTIFGSAIAAICVRVMAFYQFLIGFFKVVAMDAGGETQNFKRAPVRFNQAQLAFGHRLAAAIARHPGEKIERVGKPLVRLSAWFWRHPVNRLFALG